MINYKKELIKIVICLILLISTFAYLLIKHPDTREDDCYAIGGEYKKIGTEHNGKIIVDVYGCVK